MSDEPKVLHAAESSHWYDPRTLQPVYEVERAKPGPNGETHKAPNIGDARKLGLVPGVTTITRIPESYNLTDWKVEQGILAALTLPRGEGESEKDWIARVLTDSRETAKKAADRGTEIHKAIQESFAGAVRAVPGMELYVLHAHDALRSVCGPRDDWKAEEVVVCRLGFATKVDLCCPQWIIDWKGHEKKDATELRLYETHHMQLAATKLACVETLGERFANARTLIGYIHRETAEVTMVESPKDKQLQHEMMFRALHLYWCHKNRYFPGADA